MGHFADASGWVVSLRRIQRLGGQVTISDGILAYRWILQALAGVGDATF
jgi:hypothetical protein